MKNTFVKREAKIIYTPKGYEDLLKEKDKLLNERPEAVKNLREAREMGDLSENGYYKAARARLSFLDSRIRNCQRLIRLADVRETSGSNIVQIGSSVLITDGKTKSEYTIVGSYESDPAKKTISHLSPIGKAVLGKKINESVELETPAGIRRYKILKIS